MYLVLCGLFWIEYRHCGLRFSTRRLFLIGVCLPIALSGLLELCQEYLTATRYGDIYDFLANSVGVLTAYAVWSLYTRFFLRCT